MTTDYTIMFRDSYVHVEQVSDLEITSESIERIWAAISDECRKHGCRQVLAECIAPICRMTLADVYLLGTQIAASSLPGLSVACCFYGYLPRQLSEFLTIVAANRGIRIRFFANRAEALQWLGIDPAEQQAGGGA